MIWHVYIWVYVLLMTFVVCPGLEKAGKRNPKSNFIRKAEGISVIGFYLGCIAAVISIYALIVKAFLTLIGL